MKTKTELLIRAAQAIAVKDILETITRTGDDRIVGRRALLLAHVLAGLGTQAELARRCKLTPGRICQMVGALKRRLG